MKKMTLIFLISFLLSGYDCGLQNKKFVAKINDCDGVMVPGSILLGNKKIGSLDKARKLVNKSYIFELSIDPHIEITSAMSFTYERPLVGDYYINVTVDSSKISSSKKLSIKDTLSIL